MKTRSSSFQIGSYRPIYLWGGPGTIRMNRLKFVDVEIDELAHNEVHTRQGADRVVNQMYCNWVHLMYDWGFPPEIEEQDWDAFEQAARVYHDAGTKVFAYIQTSNCVYDGSFLEKDWYAADPRGRKITYFTYGGRYMVCLGNPEWKQHLRDVVRGAIERGADGIFFDNLFQGQQPISLFNTWLGTTGCHCSRCEQQYLGETGKPIPSEIQPEEPGFAHYLRWRANQVTQLIADLATYASELQADTPISANDYDAIVRDSYLMYGIDLEALAGVQDVTMIENYGLPGWDGRPKARLANNALSIRTARAIVGTAAHVSVLSYDVGIGFDPVYPARRYRQGIAEAAACGASLTTKGTEYHDGRKMTLLTAPEYASIHSIIGQYHTWLEANGGLFSAARQNMATVGLFYPGDALWLDWHRVAPLYFGAGQALTVEGIPWRVIRPNDPIEKLRAVLIFGETALQLIPHSSDVRVILVPELEFWRRSLSSPIGTSPFLRTVVSLAVRVALKAYRENKFVRWAMNGVGLPKIITQSPLYGVPASTARRTLLDTLPRDIYPRLKSPEPALIEIWKDQGTLQVHLVNYAANPQNVQVQFRSPVVGRIVSPDGADDEIHEGTHIDVALDVYRIMLVTQASV